MEFLKITPATNVVALIRTVFTKQEVLATHMETPAIHPLLEGIVKDYEFYVERYGAVNELPVFQFQGQVVWGPLIMWPTADRSLVRVEDVQGLVRFT